MPARRLPIKRTEIFADATRETPALKRNPAGSGPLSLILRQIIVRGKEVE